MNARKEKAIRFLTFNVLCILGLCLHFALTPLMVDAAENEPVTYISDPVTGETDEVTEYTPVTDEETTWSVAEGESDAYYVVTKDVTINGRITTSGTIHLILTDDHKLTASEGITVGEDGGLTIYGQEKGNGELEADTTDSDYWNAAAIGSERSGIAGDITINGGTVAAESYYGAGIGSAYHGSVKDITINGGTVTAISENDGAGIGSGYDGTIGNITITGGTVTAKSENDGAGIGSGEGASMGNITITGGTITATSEDDGAGIGSGYNGTVGDITITGGTIQSMGRHGAGIGGAYEGSVDRITFKGGTIEASTNRGAAVGNGADYEGDTIPVITIGGAVSLSTNSQGMEGNITIEESGNLIIPDTKFLAIKRGSTLTNNGIIINDEIFINNGTLINNNTFYNFNEFIQTSISTYAGNDPITYLLEKIDLKPSSARVQPGETVEYYADITGKGQIPQTEWTLEGASSPDTKITAGEDGKALLTIGGDETADTLIVTATCGNVSDSSTVTVEKTAQPVAQEEGPDAKANAATLNRSLTTAWRNKTSGLRLTWSQIPEADGYDIFVARSNKVSFGKKATTTITGGDNTSTVIKKLNNKKLNTKKNYKVKIKAYCTVDGQKQYIGASMVFHVAGKKSAYTNAKNIRLTRKNITLKKGRQTKIQATIVKQKKNKALLPKSYVANLRYESSDTKVASVTRNGKIKAKNRGTCTITVTAANGVRKQVKVTVK